MVCGARHEWSLIACVLSAAEMNFMNKVTCYWVLIYHSRREARGVLTKLNFQMYVFLHISLKKQNSLFCTLTWEEIHFCDFWTKRYDTFFCKKCVFYDFVLHAENGKTKLFSFSKINVLFSLYKYFLYLTLITS